MGYENPINCAYNFPEFDFGNAPTGATYHISGPAGKKGRIVDVTVALSEATVFATTLGTVEVGTAADSNAYALLNIPTASAVNTVVNSTVDSDALISPYIAADTEALITLTEGTGAGLQGKGFVTVIVAWY